MFYSKQLSDTMTLQQSYTPEQTTQVLQLYAAGVDPETIGLTIQKSTRSIISKLVQLGAYQSPEQKAVRPKKSELIMQIAQHLQLEPEQLESLEKATHGALSLLCAQITNT
jgi:response regulator RpfG family c-di-GMP phosphodiesterase